MNRSRRRAAGETAPPFDASHIDYVNVASITSATVTQSINIGAADSTRIVVVCIHIARSGTTTISSVTIGGVAATVIQSQGTNQAGGIAYAVVPTGTSASVVMVLSAQPTNLAIGSYRIVGASSATPSSTATPAGGTDASRTATLTNTSGGVSIVQAISTNSNAISNVDAMSYNSVYGAGSATAKAGINFPTVAGSLGYTVNARQMSGAHWSV